MSASLIVLLFIATIGGLIADVRGGVATVAFHLAWAVVVTGLLAATLRTGGYL